MDMRDPDEMDEGRNFPGTITMVEIIPPSDELTPWGGLSKERLHLQIRPLDHQIDGEGGSGAYPLYIPDSERKNSKWGFFKNKLKESGFLFSQLGEGGKGLLGKTFIWRRETRKFFETQERETTMLVPVEYLSQGWTPTQNMQVSAPSTSGKTAIPPPSSGDETQNASSPASVRIPPPPTYNFSELEQFLRRSEGMTIKECYIWGDKNNIPLQTVHDHLEELSNKGLIDSDETGNIFRLIA